MNKEISGRPHRSNITLLTMVRNAKIKWFSAMSIFDEISMKYGDNLCMHDRIIFSQQPSRWKRDKKTTTKRNIKKRKLVDEDRNLGGLGRALARMGNPSSSFPRPIVLWSTNISLLNGMRLWGFGVRDLSKMRG